MKTKICSKCGEDKTIDDFSFRNDSKKHRNECKMCRNSHERKYFKQNKKEILKKVRKYYIKYPWRQTLYGIKDRCNSPNHKSYKYYGGKGIRVLITEPEIKKLWFRDKAYLMKKPSIDRKKNNKDYTYDNCEYIEHSENCKKAFCRVILQYNLDGNFIREWESIASASRFVNRSCESIRCSLTGRSKTSAGFIWKYA